VAKIYKKKRVCVYCEVVFKAHGANIPFKDLEITFAVTEGKEEPGQHGKCPNCGKQMEVVSRDFKAPKKGNRQWKILRRLSQNGKTIMFENDCGCYYERVIPKATYELPNSIRR